MSAWDNPTEMLARAQAARVQGERELAYQLYARASELNPQDAQAWQGRADTATNADEALVSYAYAAALNPSDQSLERTLDAFVGQRVTNSEKGDVPLLVAVGQELAEVGLAGRAEPLLERAVELDHSSTDALVWLAGLEADKEKQIEYLNRALATNPRDARARAGLLLVKPPTAPPPSTPPAHASTATPAQEQSAVSASTQAESSMERLRRSRAATPVEPQASPSPATVPHMETPAQRGEKMMRIILLALLALVVVFALAGILLLLRQ